MKEPDGAGGTRRSQMSGVATDWRRQTKAEPEGRGSPAEPVDCRAMAERRELGAMVEPLGRRAEAEAGGVGKGFSSPADDRDWQTRGAHTEQMVG